MQTVGLLLMLLPFLFLFVVLIVVAVKGGKKLSKFVRFYVGVTLGLCVLLFVSAFQKNYNLAGITAGLIVLENVVFLLVMKKK